MTGQFPDIFIFNNESYEIAGLNGDGHFLPENYDLEPHSTCTACWRGYLLTYTLQENSLLLKNLKINLHEEKVINGITPQVAPADSTFKLEYANLDLLLNFTGSIFIGRGIVRGRSSHMGFQKPMDYKTVFELTFENGKLLSSTDISKEMAKQRKNKTD